MLLASHATVARRLLGWALPAVLISASLPAQERWAFRETLRIGGADSGPTLFVRTRSIDVDSKGRILVYERQTQDIRMFGPDGRYLRTIGRMGSGPGEMKNAEGMAIARDGRIWVRDAANARFTVFNGEGGFEKSWTMKFCMSQGTWYPQMDRQGRIVDVDCLIGVSRAVRYAILAYHTDMSRVDTIAPRTDCGTREMSEAGTWVTRSGRGVMYHAIPFAAFPVGTLGLNGETWCAPNSSRYEILRFSPGERDTLRIARNVSPVPVSRAERDSVIREIEAQGPTGLDFSRIPKTKPVVERLIVDDQERLWVRRTNAQGMAEFDLYDARGRPVATVEVGPYNLPANLPFVIRGETVHAVILDEDDVQHVARFQIVKR